MTRPQPLVFCREVYAIYLRTSGMRYPTLNGRQWRNCNTFPDIELRAWIDKRMPVLSICPGAVENAMGIRLRFLNPMASDFDIYHFRYSGRFMLWFPHLWALHFRDWREIHAQAVEAANKVARERMLRAQEIIYSGTPFGGRTFARKAWRRNW